MKNFQIFDVIYDREIFLNLNIMKLSYSIIKC